MALFFFAPASLRSPDENTQNVSVFSVKRSCYDRRVDGFSSSVVDFSVHANPLLEELGLLFVVANGYGFALESL